MKYKIAVLDDYQNAALESADWSVLRDRADITVFQDHLDDTDAVIERLPNLKVRSCAERLSAFLALGGLGQKWPVWPKDATR